MTHSRRYEEIRLTTKPKQIYAIDDAIERLKASATARFDETAEAVFKLGIKPSQVSIRGTCSLPHGTGKTLRILVFAKGQGLIEAKEAGADYVGGEDLAGKIRDGWLEFDKIVASPEMMSVVGKLGKILGPRGLMPSPKTGTVTTNVGETVEELKRGMVEFRNDRHAVAHCIFGKVSFEA
ncbi:50S ribosomal protein L1, partial [Candidatus Bipolaricaulota bacterium]|nr:50S ribosomal protein L1 [Candidatus Bipolaricaulota bacterium]